MERVWNARLHFRMKHLSQALCILRGSSPTEAKFIPWKIFAALKKDFFNIDRDLYFGRLEEIKEGMEIK